MNTLFTKIASFLDKYDSSTPELAEIFDAHPETIRRLLQDARDAGRVKLTGKWNGKAPMYRGSGRAAFVMNGAPIDTPMPDKREFRRQVDEKLSELFTAMYSDPATQDVQLAVRSIVMGAIS